jgi:two-component system sensor histidine kinase BarA
MDRNLEDAKPTATDLAAWDETAALEATGGNADLTRELAQALVQGLPQELADLRHCLQANDWPLLAERAHRMRGATSYCGVPALDTCLRDLELTARTGDRERIEHEVLRVEQQAERLARAV